MVNWFRVLIFWGMSLALFALSIFFVSTPGALIIRPVLSSMMSLGMFLAFSSGFFYKQESPYGISRINCFRLFVFWIICVALFVLSMVLPVSIPGVLTIRPIFSFILSFWEYLWYFSPLSIFFFYIRGRNHAKQKDLVE